MNVRTRTILATALAAGAAAVGAGSASAAQAAPHMCGLLSAAGKTWTVVATRVGCHDATPLAKKLIPRVPGSGYVRLGLYMTMSCVGVGGQGKHAVMCVGKTGNSVFAVSKS